jgi:hypothetical protein
MLLPVLLLWLLVQLLLALVSPLLRVIVPTEVDAGAPKE